MTRYIPMSITVIQQLVRMPLNLFTYILYIYVYIFFHLITESKKTKVTLQGRGEESTVD